MYGWRARIGLVIPTNNTVIEPEFGILAPSGVSAHAARIMAGGMTPEGISRMVENSHRAVKELQAGDMSVIAYACLATSLVKGVEWTTEFEHSVRDGTGRPATTAASATVAALHALKVSRVALATPYPDRFNALLTPLFGAADIEIVSLRSVKVADSLEVCRLPHSITYRLARESDVDRAEAVCVLATDIRTIDVLEALERDLGKPALSTNQALMWRSLALAGVNTEIGGFGSLLRSPAAQDES
jgi:maleate isomerase